MSIFLPIIAFILLFLVISTYIKGVRYALLIAAILCGLILVALTELLSLFHLVTLNWLILSWVIIISAIIILLIYRSYKWCSDNADFLLVDEAHRQDIRLAFYALFRLNLRLFVNSFPAFVPLFENFVALLQTDPGTDENETDEE